jgi:hypothetical protein
VLVRQPEGFRVLTPDILAVISDRCVAARLRGDRTVSIDLFDPEMDAQPWSWHIDVSLMCDWIARHWRPEGPAEPSAYPDAVSFLGQQRDSAGPRWYAAEGMILGYIPGTVHGCYAISAWSALPGLLSAAPEAGMEPWA